MLDSLLRPLKDKILAPFLNLFKTISPNTLSGVSFFLGLLCLVTWYFEYGTAALLFWILNRIFDGLDGAVARKFARQTDFGGYLDIILDFIFYSAFILITALRFNQFSIWVSATVLLMLYYVNSAAWMYLSAILEKRKSGKGVTSVEMPASWVEGSETIVFYTLIMILPDYIFFILLVFIALMVLTVLHRVFRSWKILVKADR